MTRLLSFILWGLIGAFSFPAVGGMREPSCARRLIVQGGESLEVFSDPRSLQTFDLLIEKGVVNSHWPLFEVTPDEVTEAGVDEYEFQNGREVVRSYSYGILYDLLLSQAARAVGFSAAKRTAGDSKYSREAAAAYFLVWQDPNAPLEKGEKRSKRNPIERGFQKQLSSLSRKVFQGFRSFASLAAVIHHEALTPEQAEEFLEANLLRAIDRMKPYLEDVPDQNLLDDFFGLLPNQEPRGVRGQGSHPRQTNYMWQQRDYSSAELNNFQITTYRRYSKNPVSRPRLLVPVLHLAPDTRTEWQLLVVADVCHDSRVLGQTLALEPEAGSALWEFVDQLQSELQ